MADKETKDFVIADEVAIITDQQAREAITKLRTAFGLWSGLAAGGMLNTCDRCNKGWWDTSGLRYLCSDCANILARLEKE